MFRTGYKESFHLGDLEPGAREKYVESMKIITGLQKARTAGPARTDWTWFCLDILDQLRLQAWYDKYDENNPAALPHRYLAQDITQAFVTMALFFPNVEVTKLVKDFLYSEEGSQFKNSDIFDPVTRSQRIPDRRSRTSQSLRPEGFFEQLEELETGEGLMVDRYPMDWSKTVRPIIAKRESELLLCIPIPINHHLPAHNHRTQCTEPASSSHPTPHHIPKLSPGTPLQQRTPTARAS
jgi:hypothetical protein